MVKDRAQSVTRREESEENEKSFFTLNLKSRQRRRIFQFNRKAISHKNHSGKVCVWNYFLVAGWHKSFDIKRFLFYECKKLSCDGFAGKIPDLRHWLST